MENFLSCTLRLRHFTVIRLNKDENGPVMLDNHLIKMNNRSPVVENYLINIQLSTFPKTKFSGTIVLQ
jgi:hypothetical protein